MWSYEQNEPRVKRRKEKVWGGKNVGEYKFYKSYIFRINK